VEFLILGPLEVRDGGSAVALGGARQRALLAILLTRANQVVSRDQLVDELWGEDVPESAVNILQTYVSHLRKVLPPDVLLTQPPGYLVRLEPDRLDLRRFERLVEEASDSLDGGRADEAARVLREALSLWRGPALAEFAYERFAVAEIARLEELRIVAIERRIEADLALGRHVDVVGELEALVVQQPLRERLRGHLMLALYRSGRQAEALDAYRDARRVLVDELGIEPSPQLQDLERAILAQDPSLALEQAPRSSPPPGAPAPTSGQRTILVAPRSEQGIDALLAVAEPLARRPPRELILARIVGSATELGRANADLQRRRDRLAARAVRTRATAFTSLAPGDDVTRLASQQDVDLLLVDVRRDTIDEELGSDVVAHILSAAPCDVAVLVPGSAVPASGPVLVPFGGAEHDWAAAEIGAWLAAVHGVPLRLLGAAGDPATGRRDASRLLSSVALLVQQVAGVVTEPLIVDPGPEAVIAASEGAGVLAMGLATSWRQAGLGPTRLAILAGTHVPSLLVRGGLRPGGLAPQESLTRFTWTIGG
jgi:DNA-binding SARP family transcriptional activator